MLSCIVVHIPGLEGVLGCLYGAKPLLRPAGSSGWRFEVTLGKVAIDLLDDHFSDEVPLCGFLVVLFLWVLVGFGWFLYVFVVF